MRRLLPFVVSLFFLNFLDGAERKKRDRKFCMEKRDKTEEKNA
jgi:hypothetical protein